MVFSYFMYVIQRELIYFLHLYSGHSLPSFFCTFVFVSVFRLLRVSSLAYPNLLGTNRHGCCIYILVIILFILSIPINLIIFSKNNLISLHYARPINVRKTPFTPPIL
jgi:hypothetical protein